MALIYKIHPAIGVARVGNSPTEFFFGPESEDELIAPQGGFKDPQCRLKRQAAKFYVYEHDTVTGETREVTGQIDNITWSFMPGGKLGGSAEYQGASIEGRLAFAPFSMQVALGAATPDLVPLGELRSDDQGRLVFLPGFGKAEPIPGSSASPPLTFASSGWYDDTCEGPLQATFTFEGDVHTLHAWALVAPPRSSPHEPPSVTLYDELVELATEAGYVVPPSGPGTPGALDKAHLHFVSGTNGGDGIEVSATAVNAGYVSKFDPLDGLRVKASQTAAFLTPGLPNPWQRDILSCAWAVWSGAGFDDLEDTRLHWAEQGLLVKSDGEDVLIEKCSATLNITLLTPELDFGSVPAGPEAMSGEALLAIVFDVDSTAGGVQLSYDVGPSGPFSQAGVLPGMVGPTGGSTEQVHFWIRYTTSLAPEDNAAVVIRHEGTDTTWTIPLHAIPVGRRTTATALVLDRSYSMTESSGIGSQKHEVMREAAKAFLDLMLPGDQVQLVRYSDTAQAVPALDVDGVSGSLPTVLDDTTREALKLLIDGGDFNPAGQTSIGAGILVGRGRLDAVPPDPISGELPYQAMVILTDGNENRPPSVQEQAANVSATTYAIGFGTEQNTSAAVLQTLANNHGGYFLVTGALDPTNQFRLEKYFLQILAGINHAEVALDPDGVLRPEREQTIPFQICERDAGFEAILVSSSPKSIDFRLVSPAGRILEPFQAAPEAGLLHRVTGRTAFYRVSLPAELEPGLIEHAGTWRAWLKLGRPKLTPPLGLRVNAGNATTNELLLHARAAVRERARAPRTQLARGGAPFTFLVNAYSSVGLRASLHQASLEPGAEIVLRASLLEANELALPEAELTAEITGPAGEGKQTLRFSPVSRGRYEARFVTSAAGTYRVLVRARGRTYCGRKVTRERLLTGSVWYGGDAARARGTKDAGSCVELACLAGQVLPCLLGTGVLSNELERRLRELGVDLDRLRECVRAQELARASTQNGNSAKR